MWVYYFQSLEMLHVSLMSSDLCEDAEIRQKILDMKDEIETNKASRTKDSVRRSARHTSRS